MGQKAKFVKLQEETRILLNKCRSKALHKNPKIARATDDIIIRMALEKFVGG